MKSQKRSIYVLMAILGVTSLVLAGASSFIGSDSFAQEDYVTVETPDTLPATGDGAEILALLRQMENISLDTALFSDPMFLGLSDFTVELIAEPASRPNPFAPIGQDVMLTPEPGTAMSGAAFSASTSTDASSPFGSI
ncbi:MAG: hypothetical protein WCT49_03880 [Candidatus Paceibacterota bacterium]|jgi:hypothetical protein|nr:hypothetical protein [Candidatus Paceibacterota bacterium]